MRNGQNNTGAQRQFVIFRLQDTDFAVPIEQVWRIVPLTDSTRVPHTPEFIKGVINLHGSIVPVVDLKKRFGLADTPYGEEARIIVVEEGGQQVGMTVDGVTEIAWLPEENIEPPPALIADINGVFLTGVATHNDRVFIILDLSRVLSPEETNTLESAT